MNSFEMLQTKLAELKALIEGIVNDNASLSSLNTQLTRDKEENINSLQDQIRILRLEKEQLVSKYVAVTDLYNKASMELYELKTPLWEKKADKLITEGRKYIGRPYRFGAVMGDLTAFDCSSLVDYLYFGQQVKLPRASYDQAKVGVEVKFEEMRKGDLVFYNLLDGAREVDHVAIVSEGGKLLQANTSLGVNEERNVDWNKGKIVVIRRVL